MPTDRVYVRSMAPALMTAEELLQTSIPDKHVELVRGVLVVREPAGLRHGRVAMELARRLGNHVDAHRLGDRKSTRLNSSHPSISYAVFCLKKKTNQAASMSTTHLCER